MLLKDIDSKTEEINQLKNLLNLSKNPKQQALIKADLARVTNGYKAEKDNAYYLDFGFKDNAHNILLHDIRIEHEGKVAQIDHIIVNRFGIEVLESKSFIGTLTINGDGSLDVAYGNKVQTFPNPIEQNNRHIKILSDYIKAHIKLPSNLKLFGIPTSSTVLINPKTTITNNTLPKGFERADSFSTKRNEAIEKMGAVKVFKSLGCIMKIDRAKEIAEFLVKHHKPKIYDYAKKYPIKKEIPTVQPIQSSIKKRIIAKTTQKPNTEHCSKCKSNEIEIVYGKYGYYFKCLSCDGNTAIKLTCSNSNCKPKIKKRKLNFYQTCESCGKDEFFFMNKEKVSN